MNLIHLDGPDDPRVCDYRSLTDTRLRRLREPSEGLYIAESSTVLRRALEAGHRPRSFFLAPKWVSDLGDVLDAHPDVPAYIGDDATLEAITGFHLHRGALAAMHRPVPLGLEEILDSVRRSSGEESGRVPARGRSRIAIFEDLVDHTNLGAAFRSAAAFGVDAVLVTPRCADPLYRRAIRVSMGTVFQVPWTRVESWPDSIGLLQEAGYVVAGMILGEEAITLEELVAEDHENVALVFGTEGQGLSAAADRLLDRRVTIPMMGGVDSLNVASASAVAFYATR